jgi:hypothetical protein
MDHLLAVVSQQTPIHSLSQQTTPLVSNRTASHYLSPLKVKFYLPPPDSSSDDESETLPQYPSLIILNPLDNSSTSSPVLLHSTVHCCYQMTDIENNGNELSIVPTVGDVPNTEDEPVHKAALVEQIVDDIYNNKDNLFHSQLKKILFLFLF